MIRTFFVLAGTAIGAVVGVVIALAIFKTRTHLGATACPASLDQLHCLTDGGRSRYAYAGGFGGGIVGFVALWQAVTRF